MRLRKITTEEFRTIRPTPLLLKTLSRTPCVVLLENVRSAHNVGSVFRTADGMRAEKLLLTGITPCPPNPHIQKTALGATEVVPWEYEENSLVAAQKMKDAGMQLVALELTHESVLYTQLTYRFPVCVVIGNEVSGVSPEMLALCDAAVSIPMLGRAHSLNVASATAIMLYEVLRHHE